MEKSASLGNLAKALATFQGKVSAIKKDAKNPFFKSTYASLGNIIETIKTPLAECGLSYCQLPDGEEGLTTILMHGDSGEYVQATYAIHAAKKDPQGIGSAITYARRYALSALLGLNTDDDDDGNEATGNNAGNGSADHDKRVAQAISNISKCQSAEELSMLKSTLTDVVKNDKRFLDAGKKRYAELTQQQPA